MLGLEMGVGARFEDELEMVRACVGGTRRKDEEETWVEYEASESASVSLLGSR